MWEHLGRGGDPHPEQQIPQLENRAESSSSWNPGMTDLCWAALAQSCHLSFPCQSFQVSVIAAVVAVGITVEDTGVCLKPEQSHGWEIEMCRKMCHQFPRPEGCLVLWVIPKPSALLWSLLQLAEIKKS